MKMKLLLATLAVVSCMQTTAQAGDWSVNIFTPAIAVPVEPMVMVPAPYIVANPYVPHYDPHHRGHDWRYWQERREHERWEHEHMEHERFEHR